MEKFREKYRIKSARFKIDSAKKISRREGSFFDIKKTAGSIGELAVFLVCSGHDHMGI